MTGKNSIRMIALIATLAMLIGACATGADEETTTVEAPEDTETTEGDAEDGEIQKGGTLVIGGEAIGDNLVPAYPFQGWGHTIALGNMFENLFTFRQFDEAKPQLATGYEVSEDSLTYTINLREDVVFHDGTPFNAEAVVFNYMRYLDEEHEYYDPNTILSFLFLPNVEEIVATDEFEVEFHLSSPSATLVQQLTFVYGGIMSPTAIREQGTENAGLQPVGTGAYKFASLESGDRITLERFDEHWDGAPPLDRVVIRAIPDEAALISAVLTGEVDLTPFVAYRDVEGLKANDSLNVFELSAGSTGYMPFNVAGSGGIDTFTDVRVRQAALHAIDRQRIVDDIFSGYGEVASGFVPKASWALTPGLEDTYAYDPEKARQLLEDAGGAPDVELLVQASGHWPRLGELIQSDLAAVGFDVSIQQIDSSAFYGLVSEGTHDFWVGDAAIGLDPVSSIFANLFGCENPRNLRFGGWCDPEFDELLRAQDQTTDLQERKELISEMEQILLENAVVGVLYYPDFVYVTSDRVKNFTPLPHRVLYLDDTYIDDQ